MQKKGAENGLQLYALVPPINLPLKFTDLTVPTVPRVPDPLPTTTKTDPPDMYVPPALAQIVASAINVEKRRRLELKRQNNPTKSNLTTQTKTKAATKDIVPTEEIMEKDFFGRPVKRTAPSKIPANKVPVTLHPIQFKYQEGFTNAVRRNVYIKDFM